MTASPEIIELVRGILAGEYGRSALAKWLAENSLHFFESPIEADRMIVSDLDVALGEIQKGISGEDLLVDTARFLIKGLGLVLSESVVCINMTDSTTFTSTTTNNSEESTVVIAEAVLQSV
jgi:hypothetical protein